MKYMLAIYRCEINKNIKPETQVNLNWNANATNISAQQYYIKKETHTHTNWHDLKCEEQHHKLRHQLN